MSQRAVRAGCWAREGRDGVLESAREHSSPTRRVLVSERVDDVAPSERVAQRGRAADIQRRQRPGGSFDRASSS